MQCLRNAHSLARLVLVWFALAVGSAVASPLIQPQASALVCATGGVMKLLPVGDDADTAPAGAGLLDCPLCLQMAAPPAHAPVPVVSRSGIPDGAEPVEPVRVTRSAGPAPGRGPPLQS